MEHQLSFDFNGEIFDEEEVANPQKEFEEECRRRIPEVGTGFVNGKERLADYYAEGSLTEQIVKKEYGVGGRSMSWDSGRGFMDHDAKGIKCTNYIDGREMVSNFSWKEVTELIKKAIYNGTYIKEKKRSW